MRLAGFWKKLLGSPLQAATGAGNWGTRFSLPTFKMFIVASAGKWPHQGASAPHRDVSLPHLPGLVRPFVPPKPHLAFPKSICPLTMFPSLFMSEVLRHPSPVANGHTTLLWPREPNGCRTTEPQQRLCFRKLKRLPAFWVLPVFVYPLFLPIKMVSV